MTLSGCVDNLSWTGVRNQGLARSTRRLISGRRHCVGTYVREGKGSSAESLPVAVGDRRFSLLPSRFPCECWTWRIANPTEPPDLAVLSLSLLAYRNESEKETVRATPLSLSPTTSFPSSPNSRQPPRYRQERHRHLTQPSPRRVGAHLQPQVVFGSADFHQRFRPHVFCLGTPPERNAPWSGST